MPLTVKQVQNAKPGRHSDGRGLYLLVKPSGARSWVLRVQHDGARFDWGIGSVAFEPIASDLPIERRSTLTLSEAREKARIGRELAKAGINPKAHWRAGDNAPKVPTFEEVARQYLAEHSRHWKNAKHSAQWAKTLKDYAYPIIGAMPIDKVGVPEMKRVLRSGKLPNDRRKADPKAGLPICEAIPETASRLKQRMGVILNFAQAHQWRPDRAPMEALSEVLPDKPEGSHHAAMPYAELPDLMGRLRASEWSVGRLALQFLILTAARSGEVRAATWGEIDLDAGEWRIPGKKMKAGKPHTVPLVPAAVELLKDLRGLFDHSPDDIVFPGNSRKPLSDATMAKALRETEGGAGYTVHGMRSTFRDWAADNGFSNDWAEAALAHTVAGQEGKTVAAYKRTTFYDQRRDRLMPAWAAFVLGDTSNVIALASRQG